MPVPEILNFKLVLFSIVNSFENSHFVVFSLTVAIWVPAERFSNVLLLLKLPSTAYSNMKPGAGLFTVIVALPSVVLQEVKAVVDMIICAFKPPSLLI